MSTKTYEEIEKLINEFDTLTKEQIKDRLQNLLIDPCPYCDVRCHTIQKYGRDIYPHLVSKPTGSYVYTVCSNCDHISSWSM